MEPIPAADYFPRLARKARLRPDPLSCATFLLYPERGLRLNASAAAILSLCDGSRNLEEIVRIAAQDSDIDAAGSEKDVRDFLASLSQRGLLEKARGPI